MSPPDNASAFFGFMGVSMALVLASTSANKQTSGQPTEQPRQEPESAASPSGNLRWWWNPLSPWSWRVSSVSTAWSCPSLSPRKVLSIPFSQKGVLQLLPGILPYGFGTGLRVQLRRNILSNEGCWVFDWEGWRSGYPVERTAVKAVRRDDSDPHFRRGPGTLRPHRVADIGELIAACWNTIHMINTEIHDLAAFRSDGRKFNELRSTTVELGV